MRNCHGNRVHTGSHSNLWPLGEVYSEAVGESRYHYGANVARDSEWNLSH